jgi:regulator of protease activity HflC (stomatin/prohibitin superfamily)
LAPAAVLLSAVGLVILPGCAVVPPGYAGVLLPASGGVQPQPLAEGDHLISPLSRVDLFDLRGQERTEDLIALTADGAPAEARASLVTYHLVKEELAAVDREGGPDYYRTIVQPIIRSTVRRVLAAYRADELSSASIVAAQQEITRIAAERLRPFHILLDALDLKTLAVIVSRHSYAQVLARGVLEQEVLAIPQKLEVARQKAAALKEAAGAVAAAHSLVAPTLTPEVLGDTARRAELQLLTSPASEVLVTEPGQPYKLEVVP